MRLYDRLMRNGSLIREGEFDKSEGNRILTDMQHAPVFVGDNVAEYVMALPDWQSKDIALAVPNAVPPFERCFIEAREPMSHWCSDCRDIEKSDSPPGTTYGAMLYAYDGFLSYERTNGERDDERALIASEVWAKIQLERMLNGVQHSLDFNGADRIVTPIRWGVKFYHYLYNPEIKSTPLGPVAQDWVFLTPEGQIGRAADGYPAVYRRSFHENAEAASDIVRRWRGRSFSLLMTIAFTHCANVSVTENVGAYENRQQRRLAERQNAEPLTRYYTLAIEPMTKAIQAASGGKQGDTKRSLHICRGHFAHYSEDKPLFGKYSGQFWIPAHVRGSIEAGKVVKDYDVKAPREAA